MTEKKLEPIIETVECFLHSQDNITPNGTPMPIIRKHNGRKYYVPGLTISSQETITSATSLYDKINQSLFIEPYITKEEPFLRIGDATCNMEPLIAITTDAKISKLENIIYLFKNTGVKLFTGKSNNNPQRKGSKTANTNSTFTIKIIFLDIISYGFKISKVTRALQTGKIISISLIIYPISNSANSYRQPQSDIVDIETEETKLYEYTKTKIDIDMRVSTHKSTLVQTIANELGVFTPESANAAANALMEESLKYEELSRKSIS